MQIRRVWHPLRALAVTGATAAFFAVPLVASATTMDGPGYNCDVAQVSGRVLAAQFCQPFGGAPGNGLVITGDFTVNALVLNGSAGIVACHPASALVPISGLVSTSSDSVQVVGINCQQVA